MSSHHIVRENQEPALVVHQLDRIDDESLGQLLEWSPTVIVSDADYDALESRGIKVDVLFLHEAIYNLDIQAHTKLHAIDSSFLKAALDYLVANHHKAVNIIAGAIDQDLLISYSHLLDIVVLDDRRRAVIVQSPYEKWKAKGERILISSVPNLQTTGLTPLGPQLFVTTESGFFKIAFTGGSYIWIEEER